MAREYRSTIKLAGIIGHPIKHSYSPLIQNAAFEQSGLDFIYLPFDIHPIRLRDAVRGLAALNCIGFNVTIPHKERILELLDELSPEVQVIGAVNTVVNDGSRLHGYNTDALGFVSSLKPFSDQIGGETVAVLGAGGAARAVLYGLITQFKPQRIYLLNRHLERAESLRIDFQETLSFNAITTLELSASNALDSLTNCKLIVNATPVGTYPDVEESPILTDKSFTAGQIIMDLVYNPPETELIRLAGKKGATVVGGSEMLLQQASESFELWTGMPMPVEKVRSVLIHHMHASSVIG